MAVPRTINNRKTYDPAIPLLSFYPKKKTKTHTKKQKTQI